MDVQFENGPRYVSDGTEETPWLGSGCSVTVGSVIGQYAEVTRRHLAFSTSTAAAGVAPGTALGTAPPLALWNPPNSGVYLSIIASAVGYISGTLGSGVIVYASVPSQVVSPTGGASLATNNNNIGSLQQSAARAFQGSTIAATATLLRPAYTMGAALATTATFEADVRDFPDGLYTVMPGGLIALQGIALAGTSPLMLMSFEWIEVPYSQT